MMEFIYNIGVGIVQNKDNILMLLTSTQFAGFVAALVGLYKMLRRTADNTKSTDVLNKTIVDNQSTKEDAKSAKENTEQIMELMSLFTEKINEMESRLENKMSVQNDKTNAMLEVQSIVYSTIKDERVRNTVNNLLVNAKYSETATRAELVRQVEELKSQVGEKTKQLSEFVNSASDKVEAIVSGVSSAVSGSVEPEVAEEEESVERY